MSWTARPNKPHRRGVYWRRDTAKWDVVYHVAGKKYHFGPFRDYDEACAARAAVEKPRKIDIPESIPPMPTREQLSSIGLCESTVGILMNLPHAIDALRKRK